MRSVRLATVGLTVFLVSCGGEDSEEVMANFTCETPVTSVSASDTPTVTQFTLTDEAWDETAVRQVLQVFAFGGFASDAQIQEWAGMAPGDAIKEIVTFDTVNPKLSPAEPGFALPLTRASGSLRCLSSMFARDAVDNPVRPDQRAGYSIAGWSSPSKTWWLAARLRGLNPVRQRMGLLETNYHFAVSHNAGVSNTQLLTLYDGTMDGLMRGDAYQDVVAWAGLSAAVAQQFHHTKSVYQDGKFKGNEDFGREYHQLFFGILGTYDDTYTGDRAGYHELVTIPNTARALTGMLLPADATQNDQIVYGDHDHWQGTLDILNQPIDGNNAQERIKAVAQIAVGMPESLDNLPVLLVRNLGDDLLDSSSSDAGVKDRVATIRSLWAGMASKNLLEFTRKYAISTAFHNRGRVKYWTSIERNLLLANLMNTSNAESVFDEYSTAYFASMEDVTVFRPAHDVFGGQTGLEARDTADVFRNAYNRAVDSSWSLTRVEEKAGDTVVWRKDWSGLMPRDDGGRVRVKAVAEWLWQRFLTDGLENLGNLERAHLYALLASGTDLSYWMDPADPDRVYTREDLDTNAALKSQVAGAEQALLRFDDPSPEELRKANYRVSLAVNFLSSLPFMFAQRGR